jgi:hypothetical protein
MINAHTDPIVIVREDTIGYVVMEAHAPMQPLSVEARALSLEARGTRPDMLYATHHAPAVGRPKGEVLVDRQE